MTLPSGLWLIWKISSDINKVIAVFTCYSRILILNTLCAPTRHFVVKRLNWCLSLRAGWSNNNHIVLWMLFYIRNPNKPWYFFSQMKTRLPISMPCVHPATPDLFDVLFTTAAWRGGFQFIMSYSVRASGNGLVCVCVCVCLSLCISLLCSYWLQRELSNVYVNKASFEHMP